MFCTSHLKAEHLLQAANVVPLAEIKSEYDGILKFKKFILIEVSDMRLKWNHEFISVMFACYICHFMLRGYVSVILVLAGYI